MSKNPKSKINVLETEVYRIVKVQINEKDIEALLKEKGINLTEKLDVLFKVDNLRWDNKKINIGIYWKEVKDCNK